MPNAQKARSGERSRSPIAAVQQLFIVVAPAMRRPIESLAELSNRRQVVPRHRNREFKWNRLDARRNVYRTWQLHECGVFGPHAQE